MHSGIAYLTQEAHVPVLYSLYNHFVLPVKGKNQLEHLTCLVLSSSERTMHVIITLKSILYSWFHSKYLFSEKKVESRI
jgi:hypothetical protein